MWLAKRFFATKRAAPRPKGSRTTYSNKSREEAHLQKGFQQIPHYYTCNKHQCRFSPIFDECLHAEKLITEVRRFGVTKITTVFLGNFVLESLIVVNQGSWPPHLLHGTCCSGDRIECPPGTCLTDTGLVRNLWLFWDCDCWEFMSCHGWHWNAQGEVLVLHVLFPCLTRRDPRF